MSAVGGLGSLRPIPGGGERLRLPVLLRSLDRRELAPDGVIHFNALAYAVPDEVASLMKAAGRNESEQEPCVPLAARHLRVPIAQAVR